MDETIGYQFITKDTDEQSEWEDMQDKDQRDIDTGASVQVEFGVSHLSGTWMHSCSPTQNFYKP